MKTLLLICLLATYSFSESENELGPQKRYFYLDVPVLGNAVAPFLPARILSLGLDVTDDFGIYIEPIVGYGLIQGFGSFFGVYYRMDNHHIGFKTSAFTLQDNGVINEYYFDFQNYSRLSRTFSLRYGFSVGYGLDKIGKDNSSGTDRVTADEGPTLRVNFDLSWRTLISPKAVETSTDP